MYNAFLRNLAIFCTSALFLFAQDVDVILTHVLPWENKIYPSKIYSGTMYKDEDYMRNPFSILPSCHKHDLYELV